MAYFPRTLVAASIAAASLAALVAIWFKFMSAHTKKSTIAILVDNGSYRPASTLSLRDMASRVASQTGMLVIPASAQFSNKVPSDQLNDVPAEIVEEALTSLLTRAERPNIVFLPAFLGASAVVTTTLPATITAVRQRLGRVGQDSQIVIARPLVDATNANDMRIAAVLVDNILTAARNAGFTNPAVAVCDHGSPSAAVTAVRDLVAAQVRAMLLAETRLSVKAVKACSMERRPEPAYDFNNPLLSSLLTTPPFNRGEVIIGLLFLSPGKHAGAGGDISGIIEEAEARAQAEARIVDGVDGAAAHARALHCVKTTLLGVHEGTIDVLADRLFEAAGRVAPLAETH